VQRTPGAFAVQVGLFANKDNAQKLVYELLDKGYDAYMDEFQASDGEIKYNVRFGRYPDRASVQSKLAEYKRAYASPAYIIITK
jgi:cell division septation protein DedD